VSLLSADVAHDFSADKTLAGMLEGPAKIAPFFGIGQEMIATAVSFSLCAIPLLLFFFTFPLFVLLGIMMGHLGIEGLGKDTVG
jgi:hypothetical protein